MGFRRFLVAFCFCFLNQNLRAENPAELNWPELARRFAVQVAWLGGNCFEPSLNSGTGTGIIMEIDEKANVAYVVTNDHVVPSDPLLARRLKIFVDSDTRVPEEVPARVVGRSNLIDMAILEFPLNALKRSRKLILPTPILLPEDRVLQGDPLLSYGHPFGVRNIVNTGILAGLLEEAPWDKRPYLQMDVAINSGNSGGPIIDLRIGKVIGISVSYRLKANNTSYAVPMFEIVAEYARWRSDPSAYAQDRVVIVSASDTGVDFLKREGLEGLIQEREPNFFNRWDGLLIVNDAPRNTTLLTGDIILAVNERVIGSQMFEFEKEIQRSSGERVKIEVIRRGKLQKLEVPVLDKAKWKKRSYREFALFSGMVVRDISPFTRWFQTYGISGVEVGFKLVSSPATRQNPVKMGALITEIQDKDGTMQPVKSLKDLEGALKGVAPNSRIHIVVHQPEMVEINGDEVPVRSDETRKPLIERRKRVFSIPFDRLITPKELSLEDLRNKLDLEGVNLAAGAWQNFIREPGCQAVLAGMGKDPIGQDSGI